MSGRNEPDLAGVLRRKLGAERGKWAQRQVTKAADAFAAEYHRDALAHLRPVMETEAADVPEVRELHGLVLYRLRRWRAAGRPVGGLAALTPSRGAAAGPPARLPAVAGGGGEAPKRAAPPPPAAQPVQHQPVQFAHLGHVRGLGLHHRAQMRQRVPVVFRCEGVGRLGHLAQCPLAPLGAQLPAQHPRQIGLVPAAHHPSLRRAKRQGVVSQ
ncbi:MAG: hypothetical protein OXE75_03710, partial [bacterium]|nr:hypothetical protein [bacterium]